MKQLILLTLLLFFKVGYGQREMYSICPIKNSDSIPGAIVYNEKGNEINLKAYIGNRPVIVVFFRGAWCPYCTRHLSALQEVKSQIDSLGFELIAITPDNFTKLDSTKVKVKDLDFTLFSDKNIHAINSFGIGWTVNDKLYAKYKNNYGIDTEWWTGATHHVLPVPAVFIINKSVVQYQHVNPDYKKGFCQKFY